ncbi:MAG: ATP synthase subunit I [bacterium]
MRDMLPWAVAGVAGLALGAFFFGGLWWTVRKGLSSQYPARWLFGSLLLRMGMTLAGFYVVGGGHWDRLVACLLGFLAARLLITSLTRSSGYGPTRATQEAGDAP